MIKPYLDLIRFNKPIGFILLALPCLITINIASIGNKNIEYGLLFIFLLGSFVMRSAGCIINDIVDRKYDAKVKRTKDRPLASGKISLAGAILLLILMLLIALLILLSLPTDAIFLGYIILIPIFLYPFSKRFTYWSQLVLALTFNWGVLMAWVSVQGQIDLEAIILYIAFSSWTLAYDTIYGHQDKEDDLVLGLKSTAVKFANNSNKFIIACYFTTLVCLWLVGILSKIGFVFYISLCFGLIILLWQVITLNINDPEDCKKKFYSNGVFGLIIFIGSLF